MTLTQLLACPVPKAIGSCFFSYTVFGKLPRKGKCSARELFVLCRILNNEPY